MIIVDRGMMDDHLPNNVLAALKRCQREVRQVSTVGSKSREQEGMEMEEGVRVVSYQPRKGEGPEEESRLSAAGSRAEGVETGDVIIEVVADEGQSPKGDEVRGQSAEARPATEETRGHVSLTVDADVHDEFLSYI